MPFFFFESSTFHCLFHVALPSSLRPTFLPPVWLQTVIQDDSGRKFLVSGAQGGCDCETNSHVALFRFSAVTEVPAWILNRTGNVRIRYHWGAFMQPVLQGEINKNYTLGLCIFSLRYPAGNAHAAYCNLWAARFYNIFSTLSHKRHDFLKRKKYETWKMCFDLLYNFCPKHFAS